MGERLAECGAGLLYPDDAVHECADRGMLVLGPGCQPLSDVCPLCFDLGVPVDGELCCRRCQASTDSGLPVGEFKMVAASILCSDDSKWRCVPTLRLWRMWCNQLGQVTGGVFHVALEDGNLSHDSIRWCVEHSGLGSSDPWRPDDRAVCLFGAVLLSWEEETLEVFWTLLNT